MRDIYRTNLSYAKNLGSAHSGLRHWMHQRVSSILLVICTCWLFSFSWSVANTDLIGIIDTIRQPYNLVMLVIFTLSALYHSMLGLQVIIEDYIHYRLLKYILLFFIQILSIITAAAFLIVVVYVMTL